MTLSFKIIRRFNVFAAVGISGLYFFKNTHNLEELKDKLELKINNSSAPVPPKIKSLVTRVMNDMNLSSEERSVIQVFLINDTDVKHLGYSDKRFGAFLGVPQHFVIDKSSDIDLIPVVKNTQISPDSTEAWTLKHLLSLSNEAKQFAIASEIYKAKHVSFYYLGLLPVFVILQGNAISYLSEKISNSLHWKFPFSHAFVFVISVWIYILLTDITNIYKQAESDYLAGELGPSYTDGGIEYYEKLLQRNKTIKKLNENSSYTEKGELKKHLGFRTYSMPFERRIQLLKDLKRHSKFFKEKPRVFKYVL